MWIWKLEENENEDTEMRFEIKTIKDEVYGTILLREREMDGSVDKSRRIKKKTDSPTTDWR